MEPIPVGPEAWSELGTLLTSLWLVVLFIVLFAANMIIGHNLIPSFLASKHIPGTIEKTRPLFYALAVICFGVAMFFLYRATDSAGALRSIWPDYWV